VSATDTARNFSDILDAVEHRGERFTIVRRGKIIAQIDPVRAGKGADIKALLRRCPRNPDLARDIASVRDLLDTEIRP
jgi:antitoxin (DNA-binding transcriptional repressor) of toxin-antitoxin stability system